MLFITAETAGFFIKVEILSLSVIVIGHLLIVEKTSIVAMISLSLSVIVIGAHPKRDDLRYSLRDGDDLVRRSAGDVKASAEANRCL